MPSPSSLLCSSSSSYFTAIHPSPLTISLLEEEDLSSSSSSYQSYYCFGQDDSVTSSVDCMVRWVFEGMSRVFNDAQLAKNVRRWLAQNPSSLDRMLPLPDACRFCCSSGGSGFPPSPSPSEGKEEERTKSSYASMLSLGAGGLEKALSDMEMTDLVEPGLMVRCTRCHRMSAISFQYDCAVRERFGLPILFPMMPDAYYTRLLARFRIRQAIAQENKKKPPIPAVMLLPSPPPHHSNSKRGRRCAS